MNSLPTPRRRAIAAAFSLVAALGCERGAAVVPAIAADVAAAGAKQPLHQQALGRDPEANGEALYDLLDALKDRFACNSVSGCPAHAALVAYGWGARPLLEATFARAPQQANWRARTIAIIAELADPEGAPLLRHLLDDRDPEVRAHAILGLGRMDAQEQRSRIRELAETSESIWAAPVKLAALYTLANWGEAGRAEEFTAYLGELATKQMAMTALMLGAHLCADPGAPDCRAVLPAMAHHPAFQARRDTLRTMQRELRPQFARALVGLTGDPAQSIRRDAENALMGISGRTDIKGYSAWLQWCDKGGCVK